jgi:uncharacterized membrane protein YdjX (TVP38/TMEM64 family)
MEAMTETPAPSARKSPIYWRVLPLVVLALGAAIFFGLGLHEYLSFDSLRANRNELAGWVDGNTALAIAAFVFSYGATTVFIPPSGTIMTVMGGFVFGAVAGTFYVVFGATLGATALFLAARMAFGDALRARAGAGIRKMEAGFRENEMSYMLVLRLVPLFPFWLVNLAPAFLGVQLRTYIIGTFFGIIPGTAVYATFGAGLGSIFDSGEELSIGGVMTPEIIIGLVGLALLAMVPVIYKRIKTKKA